jgi:hypothetical protein
MGRIHVSLLQVVRLTYMQTFTIKGLQMLIGKVNMYVGCSRPIMGTNSFGMHTINLLHGVTSIIQTWVLYVANYSLIVALP